MDEINPFIMTTGYQLCTLVRSMGYPAAVRLRTEVHFKLDRGISCGSQQNG